ncbi:MAG: HNH endonuclease signature motif containing protein [Chitinophagia bacterium]
MRPSLTIAQKTFIEENRLSISAADMAKTFGVGKGVVLRYLSRNGLSVPHEVALTFRTKANNKRLDSIIHPEDEIIKAEYLNIPVKALAAKIGRSHTFVITRLEKLGLEIPNEIIEQRKLDSYIKKGSVSFNKGLKQSDYMSTEMIELTKATRFKKGQLPHNAVGFKDGDIVIRHSHINRNSPPYKWIRLSKRNWKMLHVYMWEQAYGPVPKGHIIVFKDKNTMNVVLENFECITREENMRRNSLHRYPEEIKSSIRLIGVITRKINKDEKQNQ